MPNEYKLKFTAIANDDLDQIYNYISNNLAANLAAENLLDIIEEQITRLTDYPYSCEPHGDEFLKTKGYHKLVVNNYLIFYLVDEVEKMVVIMRIIYGARQYEKLL
jgi:toxin ParE1/3/4